MDCPEPRRSDGHARPLLGSHPYDPLTARTTRAPPISIARAGFVQGDFFAHRERARWPVRSSPARRAKKPSSLCRVAEAHGRGNRCRMALMSPSLSWPPTGPSGSQRCASGSPHGRSDPPVQVPRGRRHPLRATKILPHIHRVFGNLKTWLGGTLPRCRARPPLGLPRRVRLPLQPAADPDGGLPDAPWPRLRRPWPYNLRQVVPFGVNPIGRKRLIGRRNAQGQMGPPAFTLLSAAPTRSRIDTLP
jgi:hypothetical protein